MTAICVFCSSTDVAPEYVAAADELGRLIGTHAGILVYGGARIGLMGVVARAVHAAGGSVVGVLPQAMVEQDIGYLDADELIVTADMRSRKATMEARSDAFIALPGGFGTLEELLETAANKGLGLHDKPVALVNTGGYFDPLIALIDRMVEQRFADSNARDLIAVTASPAEAMIRVLG